MKNLLAERGDLNPGMVPRTLDFEVPPPPPSLPTTDGNRQSIRATFQRFKVCHDTETTAVLGQNPDSAKALGI